MLQRRLQEYLRAKSLTFRDFERICGLSNGTAARLRESTRKSTFDRIANNCDLNVDWLLTGEGEMYTTPDLLADAAAELPERLRPMASLTKGVPYYDEDFRLGFQELYQPFTEAPQCMLDVPGFSHATLWCRASGNSMEPEISGGDIVALQQIEDFRHLIYGDIYAIVTTDGQRTIKRVRRSTEKDCYLLVPTNPNIEPQDIPLANILRVFRVMGSIHVF